MTLGFRSFFSVVISSLAVAGVAFGQAPSAPAPAGFVAPVMPTFTCQGNEPFWNLRISSEDAVLGGVDRQDRPFRGELTWLKPSGIYAWNGRAEDVRSDKLEALIDEHRCRDTMADEIFPYRVRIRLPGAERVEGCCRTQASGTRPAPPPVQATGLEPSPLPAASGGVEAVPVASEPPGVRAAAPAASEVREPVRPTRPEPAAAEPLVESVPPVAPAPAEPPALAAESLPNASAADVEELPPGEAPIEGKPEDDWSRLLGDLLPAIDVCLGRVDDSGAVVTKAWPMSGGMTGVRIVDRDGRRWDCFAPATAHTVDRLEPIAADAPRLPGEGSPMFTRAGGRPPKGDCLRNEVISDETGRRVGWLSYKTC